MKLKDIEEKFENKIPKEVCFDFYFYQLPKQQMEIMLFIVNSKTPVSVKDISKHTELQSKNISAQLIQMQKSCYRLKSKMINKKNKLYFLTD